MTRVLLVDDHASVRQAIAILLDREPDMAVVGQAGSLAEAKAVLAETEVDIAVVDRGLPDGDGLELISDLRAGNPDAAVLVLTAETDRRSMARAIEAGASSVLNKAAPLEELLSALRSLAAGESLNSKRELLDLQHLAGRTRVLLVDDHASVRQALAILLDRELDMAVVGQAGSLAEARTVLAETEADIAVVDLGLPDGDGVDLIRDMRAVNPDAAILVLTSQTDPRRWAKAVEAGASGVLDKAVELREVLGALRRLAAGEPLMSTRELLELMRFASREREQSREAEAAHSRQSREAEAALGRLTARENEVLQGVAEGLSDKEIAERLYISGKTVRSHVASILAKFGVESRLQALIFAVRHGAIDIH